MNTIASAAVAAAGGPARELLVPPLLSQVYGRHSRYLQSLAAAGTEWTSTGSRSIYAQLDPQAQRNGIINTACHSLLHRATSAGGCCVLERACCSSRPPRFLAAHNSRRHRLQQRKKFVDNLQQQQMMMLEQRHMPKIQQQELASVPQHKQEHQKQQTAEQPRQQRNHRTTTPNTRRSSPCSSSRFFHTSKKKGSGRSGRRNSSCNRVSIHVERRCAALTERSQRLQAVTRPLLRIDSRRSFSSTSSSNPSSSSSEKRVSSPGTCAGCSSARTNTCSLRSSCSTTGCASSRSSSNTPSYLSSSTSTGISQSRMWLQDSRSRKTMCNCGASPPRTSISSSRHLSTIRKRPCTRSPAGSRRRRNNSSSTSTNGGINTSGIQALDSSRNWSSCGTSLIHSGSVSLTSSSGTRRTLSSNSRQGLTSSNSSSSTRRSLSSSSSLSSTNACSSLSSTNACSSLSSMNACSSLCSESPSLAATAPIPRRWLASPRYSFCRSPQGLAAPRTVPGSSVCPAIDAAGASSTAAQNVPAAVAEEKMTTRALQRVERHSHLSLVVQHEGEKQQQRFWRQQRQRQVLQQQQQKRAQRKQAMACVALQQQRQAMTLQRQQEVKVCGVRGLSSSSGAATAAGGGRGSSSRSRSSVGQLLGSSEHSLVDVPVPPKPRKYFDLKTFQRFLLRYKQREEEAEEALVRRTYTKPLPEGWTVLTFLNRIGIKENAEAVVSAFPTWVDLANASVEALRATEAITDQQRRLILKHIRLYNHGLWPENTYEDYIDRFQAEPLANEGKPWTEADDTKLLELARKYDVNFGDPWLYISWELQRDFDDVQSRYTELVTIPRNKTRRCEVVLTKCTKPLFFSRYFKLLPPKLFVIPSSTNFCTDACAPFTLPKEFLPLRRDCCFRQPPPTSSNSPSPNVRSDLCA